MSSSPETEPKSSLSDAPIDEHERVFQGDTGELSVDTRRVLVQLLMGPSLDARRQSRLWPILLRDELIIRRRLHELFLDLVVDRDHYVAFTRQVMVEEPDIPVLLRRAQLTFLDSVLLLFLRQRLTQAETQGDRAVVSVDEIVEHLKIFERTGNTDRSTFAKRMQSAIEKVKKHSVLQKIRGSEERLEVSPTLKLLFSAEEVQALTQIYRTMGQGMTQVDIDEDKQISDPGRFEEGEAGE